MSIIFPDIQVITQNQNLVKTKHLKIFLNKRPDLFVIFLKVTLKYLAERVSIFWFYQITMYHKIIKYNIQTI